MGGWARIEFVANAPASNHKTLEFRITGHTPRNESGCAKHFESVHLSLNERRYLWGAQHAARLKQVLNLEHQLVNLGISTRKPGECGAESALRSA